MSSKKSFKLFFTCLALFILLSPSFLYAITLEKQQHYLQKDQLISELSISKSTLDSLQRSNPASIRVFLNNYINKIASIWNPGMKNETADSLIKIGFSLLDSLSVNDTIVAETYHSLGKVLVDKNQNQRGIDTLKKAIDMKKRVYGENSPELSKTYNYIGIGFYHARNYDSATHYYSLSVNQKIKNKIVDEDLFDSYMNLGVLNSAYGKFNEGYKYLDLARRVIDSAETSFDSIRTAVLYYSYGNLATLNGKFKEANDHYEIAERIYLNRFGENYVRLGGIYTNKGTNSVYNYDYNQALLFYKNALEINLFENQFQSRVPMSYANLSWTAMALKDYTSAVEYSLEGLKYNPSNDIKIALYKNLAQSYTELGKKDKAQEYYLKAINLDQLTTDVNPIRSISLYTTYATFLTYNDQIDESKKYFKLALLIARNSLGENSAAYATQLAKLGDYFLKDKNNLDSAINYYDQSIGIWNKKINAEKDTIAVENFNNIRSIDAYSGKAHAVFNLFKQTGDTVLLSESSALFKTLLERTDLITKNLDKENSYILLEILQPVYISAIEVAFEKYKLTGDDEAAFEAFDYAERSKSTVLLASIQNNNALKTAEVPEEILNLDEQLQSEINSFRKLLADEEKKPNKSLKKVSFFNSTLLKLMITHDSLVDEIEKNYPKYYALKYDRSVIDVTTVKNNLDPDEALIEYVLTDSSLFIFSISKENQHLQRVPVDSSFYSSLDYLINIKNVDLNHQHGDDFKKFIKSSNNLYNILISPVYAGLSGKRLIIIPDDKLGYLSFDILLKPSSNNYPDLIYKTLPYLLKEFPISYAYSSSLKYNTYFINDNKSMNNLIGFAPLYASVGSLAQINFNNNLKPLPGAESEVLDAKKIFGGVAYLNDKATKNNFLRNAPDYRIIHLAMHTLINDSLPMFSELVFTENSNDTTSYKLLTYEIYGLNLNADMVTLSACNTGTGKLQHGEGIMSLSRGFVYAGVPSIVMTLWDVQDNSSSDIMKKYYTYLQMGYSKDNALRKSKLDFLDNTNMLKAHPYYWSAYIVTGDSSPLITKKPKNRIEIITGISIFLLVIILIIFNARRAKR